jgi:multidrug efflux system outer membrane protein
MHHLFKLFFLFLLSGCMVGPDYHAPCLDMPESFHYMPNDATGNLNVEWWTQFNDPVLNDLIVEALANNYDVKIAAANVDFAVGILIQTRAPLLPQIGYDLSYTRTRISEDLATTSNSPIPIKNPQTTWQAILTGSWELDVWGRVRRLVESARANVFASIEARQQVILSLVASVASTYIQLRSLDEQLVISENTMKSYHEAVIYFEKQFKYGQTSMMTVASARTQYELAASNIPHIKQQIVDTENALSVLLGSNPKTIPRGKSIYALKAPEVPPDLPSSLLCQRPDIRQAEEKLIAANAQIGAAVALYFPSITLTGFYGNASQDLKHLFSGPANTWSFMGNITGPIFTAGAIYGQVFQAEALQQEALNIYKQTIQNAFADVENSLVARTMLIDQVAALRRLVKAAGEYEYLSTLQYKGGYSPYFVVIQAQQQYFPAQLSWVQAKANLLNSYVDIYRSLGGGWVVLAESKTHPNCEGVVECYYEGYWLSVSNENGDGTKNSDEEGFLRHQDLLGQKFEDLINSPMHKTADVNDKKAKQIRESLDELKKLQQESLERVKKAEEKEAKD